MVEYSFALATIVAMVFPSSSSGFVWNVRNDNFISSSSAPTIRTAFNDASQSWSSVRRRNDHHRVAASISAAFNNERDDLEVLNISSSSESVEEKAIDEDDVDEYEAEMERRKQALMKRQPSNAITYEISIPIVKGTKVDPVEGVTSLAPADDMVSQQIGLSLREVARGAVLSEFALDLDTLQYQQSLVDERIRDSKRSTPQRGAGSVQLLTDTKREIVDEDFTGLVVSSVVRGGLAWNSGVRVGDKLMASSATIGEKMWPKSTLDGVRSAITSRKLISSKMRFEFQRAGSNFSASTVSEEFELQIARPMGINVEDTEEGFVRVSGLTDQALESTKEALRPGDRIVAVDSAFGKRLWPVSSVEGLVSACTTRLPGQPVKLRFERLVEVGEYQAESLTDSADATEADLNGAIAGFRALKAESSSLASTTTAKTQVIEPTGSKTHKLLLSRCRDILRRYMSVYKPSADKERIVALPSMVADRVLDAIADASAPLDAKTLTLLMNSYLICGKSEEAIKVFEAATGLSANGCAENPKTIIPSKKVEGGQLQSDIASLNLYSATALLRAHALKRDCVAAAQVLAAMQGTGDNDTKNTWMVRPLKADIQCYNIVLAAAARAGGQKNLNMALDIFESLSDYSSKQSSRPKKNLVTYNTIISAYANAGRREEAFTIFNSMRQVGLKPDKFTITSLIKACIADGDLEAAQTLLKNMRKANIEVDLRAYNTVIQALCDNLKWYEAKELVTDMEFRGVKPDGMTYGLLMNGLLKANKPGPCLTLFEAACSDQSTVALTENVKLYTTAITAAATIGDYERALELVSRMTFSGLKPNIKTLTALMGACISGNKPDLALDVFKKISAPDGYCTSLALRAYCDIQDFSSAMNILSIQGDGRDQLLSGKQIMSSYNNLIRSSLENQEYDIAREALSLLLGSGFIPSKKTFKAILDGLGLVTKKIGQRTRSSSVLISKGDEKKFDFLLGIIDMLDTRKLQFDCNVYTALLFEGSQLGGLRKKVASLIAERRRDGQPDSHQLKFDNQSTVVADQVKISWSDLIKNYSDHKSQLENLDLPLIRLRVGERDIRQVLAAERGVTYNNSRQKKITGKSNRS